MNQNSIQQKLEPLLQSPFDAKGFAEICSEIAGQKWTLANNKIPVSDISNSAIYTDTIASVNHIGTMHDDGEHLHFVIINLPKADSVINARTRQRDFAVKYLDHFGISAGVFAYTDNTGTWRLSFVKVDGEIVDGKFVKSTTPAKRYSFMVGKDEKTHTATQRIGDLLEGYPNSIKTIEHAFSVEAVSKEFFEHYKALFERLNLDLKKFLHKPTNESILKHFIDIGIQQETDGNIHYHDFCKRLLGQISFLYFVQKKGWLGVPRDKQWGQGNKYFLRTLFKNKGDKNYFNDILEPLFYQGLADERDDDGYYHELDCKIPFLNGGLFAPFASYDWINTDITLDDELFSNSDGDGILDIFDTYNFTVAEDSPIDQEVAVDPEMLGKVFENLLEENYRKGKGAFYTPREVVHYMCQQALINHLQTHNPNIERPELENFVASYNEDCPDCIKSDKSIAQKLDNDLKTITICDPAIGSGAFPVGMLHEIVNARTKLQPILGNDFTTYDLKRNAIENNLYGVDLDAGAIDIAKLRLWLSLIVDEDNISDIKPLPNLGYKIMQGNSLIESYDGIDLSFGKKSQFGLFAGHDYSLLDKKKKDYFVETDRNKKKKLAKDIDSLLLNIVKASFQGKSDSEKAIKAFEESRNNQFFLWNIYFSEVFEKVGFDIIIGNPPYIPYKKATKLYDLSRYGVIDNGQVNKPNLYCFFIEKSVSLLKNSGILSFINPIAFLVQSDSIEMRKLLLKKDILELIDVSFIDLFKNADTYTVLLLLKNQSNTEPIKAKRLYDINDLMGKKNHIEIDQNDIMGEDLHIIISDHVGLLKRIALSGRPIWHDVEIQVGTSQGGFGKKIIAERKEGYTKVLTASDIFQYKISSNYKYIDNNVFNGSSKLAVFGKKKIVTSKMTDKLRCYIDNEGFFCGKVNIITVRSGSKKLELIAALLNSHIFHFYYKETYSSLHKKGGAFGFDTPSLEKFCVPATDETIDNTFKDLVDYVQLCRKHGIDTIADYFTEIINIAIFGLYFQKEMDPLDCYITDGLWEFIEPLPDADIETQKQFLKNLYNELQKEPYIAKAFMMYRKVKEIETILREVE